MTLASNADLFNEDRNGWPVLQGKNMHQFNHAFSTPAFTTDKSDGLAVLEKKKNYASRCRDFHESYVIVFPKRVIFYQHANYNCIL